MSEERRIPFTDRRRTAGDASPDPGVEARDEAPRPGDPAEATPAGSRSEEASPSAAHASPEAADTADAARPAPDYLEDLRRVQAEFENYRKRMMRDQAALADRASARMVERLLPVLDDLERAVAHGVGGGIDLIVKSFKEALAAEGVEEIPALGEPFDPRLHEAFQLVEDPSVGEPVCRTVLRSGYRIRDLVLRPAMVSVARPPEDQPADGPADLPAAGGEQVARDEQEMSGAGGEQSQPGPAEAAEG